MNLVFASGSDEIAAPIKKKLEVHNKKPELLSQRPNARVFLVVEATQKSWAATPLRVPKKVRILGTLTLSRRRSDRTAWVNTSVFLRFRKIAEKF